LPFRAFSFLSSTMLFCVPLFTLFSYIRLYTCNHLERVVRHLSRLINVYSLLFVPHLPFNSFFRKRLILSLSLLTCRLPITVARNFSFFFFLKILLLSIITPQAPLVHPSLKMARFFFSFRFFLQSPYGHPFLVIQVRLSLQKLHADTHSLCKSEKLFFFGCATCLEGVQLNRIFEWPFVTPTVRCLAKIP